MGRLIALPLLATLLLGAALPAAADDHARARRLREAGEILPLQQILAGLGPDVRVLEVELEQADGRYLYEVEVLDRQGEVWEYRYDARNGELLGKEHED